MLMSCLNYFGQSFLSIIETFSLKQHVTDPSHMSGHTLDLVISRDTDNLLAYCFVAEPISDHFAVHWLIKANRPFTL